MGMMMTSISLRNSRLLWFVGEVKVLESSIECNVNVCVRMRIEQQKLLFRVAQDVNMSACYALSHLVRRNLLIANAN